MAASDCQPFEFRLSGFGVFPNERKARIFAGIRIAEGVATLKNLARRIDQAVVPLGFPREEREFSAHITLARFREPGPVDRLMNSASRMFVPESENIRVGSIELMKSVLSSKGATYSVIETVRLTPLHGEQGA